MKTMFERKPSDFRPSEFVVAKTIQLSADMFESVLKAPLRDYDFIEAHKDLMYCDENKVFHCLLLTGEGRSDGILVESEGYAYCRYAAYVPEVLALCSSALQELNERMVNAVNYIVTTGTQNTLEGNWIIGLDEVEKHCGLNVEFNAVILDSLVEMIREQEAVADVQLADDGIDVCYYLSFCHNCQTEQEDALSVQAPAPTAPVTTLRDLLHTRWEDVHLMHKDIEGEPHTIVELDAHTLTDAGKAAWADILNAEVSKIYTGFYGLQIELCNVKPHRLDEFSAMLGGYCSIQEHEKWVRENPEQTAQLPEMGL